MGRAGPLCLAIDPKGLTTDLKLAKNPASRTPASQATSSPDANTRCVVISAPTTGGGQ
jgi:hypothetical protein